MIDREAFGIVMAGFADRIGRALAPTTSAMYYDVLAEALTTEEFLAGARIVFRTHHWNTWPAPDLFIEAAKPPTAAKLSAAEAFEQVMALTGPQIEHPGTRVAALGPVVERAYRAAGGLREFRNVLEADLKWLRKSFVEAYELAAADAAKQADAQLALEAVDAAVRGLIEDTATVMGLSAARLAEARKRLTESAGQPERVERGDA